MSKLRGKQARASASLATIDYRVQSFPISNLRPNPGNVRTHSKRQVRQIANSIQAFGCLVPALVDENNMILAGNGRVEAAKYLGMKTFPGIRVDHLTEAQKRTYILADNKLAQNAGWDRERLYGELMELSVILIEEDLDLGLTGFDTAELDAISLDFQNTPPGSAETLPPLPINPVCRLNDLWKLGEHRVACGDARDDTVYGRLMGGSRAFMIIHGPSIQRQDLRACRWQGPHQTPRVWDSLGRALGSTIHGILDANIRLMCRALHRWLDTLCVYGLATPQGSVGCWRRGL
jgi:ParB-like nuclease domain